MKRNVIICISFLLCVILFIGLRVYAGNHINFSTNTTDKSVSPTTTPSPDEATASTDSSENANDEAITILDDAGLMNDPWHGDFAPVKAFWGVKPRIVCWGDSLTESIDNKTAYPDFLRELSGCEVINYGVRSELTSMIAMREGGLTVKLNATVIPANTEMIPIFLYTDTKTTVHFLDNGDGGVNPCSINGIEGTLEKLNGSYYFTRSEQGERTAIDEGTIFTTYGMSNASPDDVLVIFTGTNDKPDSNSIYDIISLQHDMIDYAGCSKYIVVGLTYSEDLEELDTVNEILANEYEDHFLDIRTYLLNYGLSDAKIEPTIKDKKDLINKNVPSSLRSDLIHGNKTFYKLLATQLYRRMQYLGYLPIEN